MFHRTPIRKPDRQTRVALRLDDWPEEDRARWASALQDGDDIFDEAGLAARWRPATRQRAMDAYGRWLGELARHEPEALRLGTSKRVTRERIIRLCEILSETNTGVSVATHLRAVRDALRVMAPEQEWRWIHDLAKQIDHQSFARSKANRVRTSDEIAALGLSLIAGAEQATATGGIDQANAIEYRDGLILLILAHAPLRRKNLAGLEVGRTLVSTGDTWTITLRPDETKSRTDYEHALPAKLSKYINRYLEAFRPAILKSSTHSGFFASAKGCPLPADGAYQAICNRTHKAFGVTVNPHLIRDGAQTMWALDNPKQIRAVGPLLGHADPKTGERHYNQARSITAAKKLATVIRARKLINLKRDAQ